MKIFSSTICKVLLYSGAVLLFYGNESWAQSARTFQNFFFDGSHVGKLYGDVGFQLSDLENRNVFNVGGQIGFPIGRSFELGGMLNFITIDYESSENRSGFSDLTVIGRQWVSRGSTDISVGGGLTLPIGDEDVQQGMNVNLHFFGALRHRVNASVGVTGVLGIDFLEEGDDYDASLRLGGGVIYRSSARMQLLGELNILTDPDYALLSFGIDYQLSSGSRLRPALGIGVDNGAPDFVLILRLLFL